jgi:hypothetical protein
MRISLFLANVKPSVVSLYRSSCRAVSVFSKVRIYHERAISEPAMESVRIKQMLYLANQARMALDALLFLLGSE